MWASRDKNSTLIRIWKRKPKLEKGKYRPPVGKPAYLGTVKESLIDTAAAYAIKEGQCVMMVGCLRLVVDPLSDCYGEHCPECGMYGQWRNGVGFEHEKICSREESHKSKNWVTWVPGEKKHE